MLLWVLQFHITYFHNLQFSIHNNFLAPTKSRGASKSIIFLFARKSEVIASAKKPMPYRYSIWHHCTRSIIFTISLWHRLFHKSNQKHPSQQIKKWYTCFELLPTHYVLFFHCFCKYWKSLETFALPLKLSIKWFSIPTKSSPRNGNYSSIPIKKPFPLTNKKQ